MTIDLAALLQGFGGHMSALRPAGPQAARIATLWWVMLAIATAVTLAVVVAALLGVARRRAHAANERARERTAARWVGGAVGASVLLLLATLLLDFRTGRAMGALPASPDTLVVRVTGYQWWWEVEYDHPNPSRRLTTANEIHVPVGTPVVLRLSSRDVNHSIWVPNLHGKRDLIPGREAMTWFRADTPGVYRGQCAEFCGHQHALMGLLVVAEPPGRFARWYEQQLRPAAPPTGSVAAAGQRVFLTRGCALCHTVRGTPAGSRAGPELTHVASRGTLAAGTLPNTRGHLAGWIVNPQAIKPGARMPPNALAPEELLALLAYLESLR